MAGLAFAHRSSLYIVLVNLLTNALKFVAPGTRPAVKLWTEVRPEKPDGSFIRLWVQDNGIGIPEQGKSKIFGIFERLHSTETYPGTGIGLAVVKRAVERMGGRVGVAPGTPQGSRFWVDLRRGGQTP